MEATLERQSLVKLLGATVGLAKAEAALAQAQQVLGLLMSSFTQTQTLQILDELARSPSVLGISAKCLRVRMVLRFGE